MNTTKQQKFDAIASLKKIFLDDKIFVQINATSSTGLQTELTAFAIQNNTIINCNRLISNATSIKLSKNGCLKIHGYGLCKSQKIVEAVSLAVYNDAYHYQLFKI
jgi:hypothetical protein